MRKTEITQETKDQMKRLPKMDYKTYLALIEQKQVTRLAKLKYPRTIWFDEETGMFIYLNPYHQALCKCGRFTEEEQA